LKDSHLLRNQDVDRAVVPPALFIVASGIALSVVVVPWVSTFPLPALTAPQDVDAPRSTSADGGAFVSFQGSTRLANIILIALARFGTGLIRARGR
jgi:hypothetical protein